LTKFILILPIFLTFAVYAAPILKIDSRLAVVRCFISDTFDVVQRSVLKIGAALHKGFKSQSIFKAYELCKENSTGKDRGQMTDDGGSGFAFGYAAASRMDEGRTKYIRTTG